MTGKTWFVAIFCALSLAQPASAQDWPTKPIRFITAFAAGSASDVLARIVADRLTVALGQQVIIDGRAGGNGVIAATIAAKSAPDGYTYLLVFDNHATNPSLQKKLPYDTLKDFSPLTLLADSPYGLVVGLATPYRTLKDLIAAAKSQPGKLTAGSSGAGSRGQLAIALLGQRGGFEITQISYRGPAQAMTDLLGGQITMRMSVVFFIMPFVKTERVRILGVTTAARLAQLPEVPTIAEQGFPGYEVYSWWGIVAPAGVPKPIFQKMHAELIRALNHPETRDRVAQLGATVHPATPEEFDRYIRNEMNLWGKIVRDYKFSQTE